MLYWSEIKKANVDQINKYNDINSLGKYLKNFTEAKFDCSCFYPGAKRNDAPEKLMRVMQMTIEYLLFTQNYL